MGKRSLLRGRSLARGVNDLCAFLFGPSGPGVIPDFRIDRLEERRLMSADWQIVGNTYALEGEPLSFTSVPPDGETGTFSRLWTAKRNGVAYASSTDAAFSFTPDDQGTYEVDLMVRGG